MTDIALRAARFAAEAHRGQQRKYTGKPYFSHCASVAFLVMDRTRNDPAMVAAAYLHDTLEDTETTYEQLVAEFGPMVAGLVREVTDVYTSAAHPSTNRASRKRAEADRLATISPAAKLIKYCDLIDNTSSIVKHDAEFAVVYLREKANIIEAMLADGWKPPVPN